LVTISERKAVTVVRTKKRWEEEEKGVLLKPTRGQSDLAKAASNDPRAVKPS